MAKGQLENDGNNKLFTSIAIWKSTKEKLDRNRAPGQCYNGFICQLVDMWEQIGEDKIPSRLDSSARRSKKHKNGLAVLSNRR
jgi:hypothetical protein